MPTSCSVARPGDLLRVWDSAPILGPLMMWRTTDFRSRSGLGGHQSQTYSILAFEVLKRRVEDACHPAGVARSRPRSGKLIAEHRAFDGPVAAKPSND